MSFFNSDGVQMHYQRLGGESSPLTVVFLHGLVMDNLSSWFFTLANPMAQIAQVILYDLRGHGFSERPLNSYSIEQHIIDFKNMYSELKLNGPVLLIGNSFGGLLALNLAHELPELVRGLILVDSQINDRNWGSQMAASLSAKGESQERLIRDNFKNWLGRNSQRKSNRLATLANELVNKTTLIADLKSSKTLEDSDLKEIKTKSLAIYGENSDAIASAKKLSLLLDSCELKLFSGCTHSVLWEQTEEVKKTILDWVISLKDSCKDLHADGVL